MLTASCKLVVDLLFEEAHRLTGEVTQHADELLATQQTIKTSMTVGKVLGSAQDALAFVIDLLESFSS